MYAEDAVALSSAYGLADVEAGDEADHATPVPDRLALEDVHRDGVFQLAEQGRLRLDDKAGRTSPSWSGRRWAN